MSKNLQVHWLPGLLPRISTLKALGTVTQSLYAFLVTPVIIEKDSHLQGNDEGLQEVKTSKQLPNFCCYCKSPSVLKSLQSEIVGCFPV